MTEERKKKKKERKQDLEVGFKRDEADLKIKKSLKPNPFLHDTAGTRNPGYRTLVFCVAIISIVSYIAISSNDPKYQILFIACNLFFNRFFSIVHFL